MGERIFDILNDCNEVCECCQFEHNLLLKVIALISSLLLLIFMFR